MYNHLLNELIHFWLKNPNATLEETLMYAVAERMVEVPSSEFIEYIKEQHSKFQKRKAVPKDWIDDLPDDNTPICSNPFMEDFHE